MINAATGKTASSTSHSTPAGTWFPDLHVDLCDLVDEGWDPWINSPFLVMVATPAAHQPHTHTRAEGTHSLRPLRLPGDILGIGAMNQMWRSRVLFLCSMGMQIYCWISWKPPIKDDLIAVTQFRDTQTSRAGSHIRKDTQPPRRETCGSCFEPLTLWVPQGEMQQSCHQVHSSWQEGQLDCW